METLTLLKHFLPLLSLTLKRDLHRIISHLAFLFSYIWLWQMFKIWTAHLCKNASVIICQLLYLCFFISFFISFQYFVFHLCFLTHCIYCNILYGAFYVLYNIKDFIIYLTTHITFDSRVFSDWHYLVLLLWNC